MQFITENKILRYRHDTLEVVRRDVNLDSPERVNEAVDILEDWIKKQPHFVKKDYSREYLEKTVHISKGLVEKAKTRLDKLCTLKTLMPEFFVVTPDLKEQYEQLGNKIPNAFMPHQTENSNRIYVLKVISDFDSNDIGNFFRIMTMYGEYLRRNECTSGFHIVIDFRDGNIMNAVANLNPVILKRVATIIFEGYGFRIKSIYLVSPSKAISLIASLFKQVISAKLGSRIQVIEDIDSLYQYVPQELMPAEYGGKEKPLRVLNDEWMDEVTSEESMKYYAEMCKAATVESCRPADMFDEQYVEMSGSFRALTVD